MSTLLPIARAVSHLEEGVPRQTMTPAAVLIAYAFFRALDSIHTSVAAHTLMTSSLIIVGWTIDNHADNLAPHEKLTFVCVSRARQSLIRSTLAQWSLVEQTS